jgi:hypothetical protein
MVNTRNNQCNG